jgi:DNA polymerase-3 subunit beta
VINARLLFDMIRKVSSEDVSIDTDENCRVSLRCGITKFDFSGINALDFPELPSPDTETALAISGVELKEMIERTLFAVAQDNQKPVHTGTKFFLEINHLTLVSVDGYRLAVCEKPIINTDERNFVVPAKTLAEVSHLIGDSEDEIYLSTAKRYAVFSLKGYSVVTRLLEGDFLDYKRAIPEGWKTRVKISVSELFDAVERASLLITDRIRSPVRLRFDDNTVIVNCVTTLGSAHDEIEAEMTGETVEIGFNNRYILDALRHCGAESVYLEINESTSPMKVVPIEGDAFLFLVLPVRIKTE